MQHMFIHVLCDFFFLNIFDKILQVQNEVRRCCFKRRLNSFNTRSILLSSWRKSSRRTSRDMARDTRLTDCTFHGNNCSDTCKLNNTCESRATWPRKSHIVHDPADDKFKTLSSKCLMSEHNM